LLKYSQLEFKPSHKYIIFRSYSKMVSNLQKGNQGEKIAQEFLRAKDFQIIDCNWRTGRAEIDIIAKDGQILVFVEVKTRAYDFFGSPEEFVSDHKQKLISEAASVYMEKIKHDWEIRFDVIAIILKNSKLIKLEHFQDAWF
jgi:putative endonuclease